MKYRPNTQNVLRGLRINIEAGTKVGLVGRTGAGKSTIASALTRIIEICGGKIEIDGVDISKVKLE